MKPRQSTRRILPFHALILAGLLAGPSAQAAPITWSGATNTWNTGTNWVGGVLPVSNDSLTFDVAGAGGLLLNNDHPSFNVAGITFNPTGVKRSHLFSQFHLTGAAGVVGCGRPQPKTPAPLSP